MNREILFRAKNTDSGEWIEGSYIKDYSRDNEYRHRIQPLDGQMFAAKVNPDTICQYTGLTDKNGKKVYENDVLMCFGDPKYLVKVLFNEFEVIDGDTELPVESVDGWNYVWIKPTKMSKCEYPMPLTNLYFKTCKMEVVGNTFDNTELLEDKKDETI